MIIQEKYFKSKMETQYLSDLNTPFVFSQKTNHILRLFVLAKKLTGIAAVELFCSK